MVVEQQSLSPQKLSNSIHSGNTKVFRQVFSGTAGILKYFGKYFTGTAGIQKYFGHLRRGIYVVVRVRAGKYQREPGKYNKLPAVGIP
jgi:hypothetical protein